MREIWVRFCGTYQSRGGVLAQPEIGAVLRELATLYFAIPPPRSQNANPSVNSTPSRWTAKHGPNPAGDEELHHYIGELLYKEGSFVAAEPPHNGRDEPSNPQLIEQCWHEISSLHAQSSLDKQFITGLPKSFDENSATIPVVPVSDPEEDKNKAMWEIWVRLCGTYQSRGGVLAQPEIRAVLRELATLYFAIPPPRSQNANPLGEMLSSIFGSVPSAARTNTVLE
ncbi:hypothetical protein C8J56DRAFT_1048180 [Mycena floridula]|nr:hypothetical protein C8J56DRAFT_1048180 [Mycena floridula]